MSGQSKLIVSEVQEKGGSYEEIAQKLLNENEVVAKKTNEKKKK